MKFIVTCAAHREGVLCLVCNRMTTHMGYNSRLQCEHCGLDHHYAMTELALATHHRLFAIVGWVLVFWCALATILCTYQGLTGDHPTLNAIGATINLATAIINIRTSRREWKRWRAIKPLYEKLKREHIELEIK